MNTCTWKGDDDGVYSTGCDNAFQFEVDGPTENNFKFCPYCGKELKS